MKTFLKTIIFQIGVDCLGFPQFHKHELTYKEKKELLLNFITPFHKKYHLSIKHN